MASLPDTTFHPSPSVTPIPPNHAILMVLGLIPGKLGSFERFMIRLAERFREMGCDVDFLVAGEPLPEIKDALTRSGSSIYVLEDWLAGTQQEQVRRFVSRYEELTRKRRYGLVTFSFCDTRAVLQALWSQAFRPSRPRVVWHQHSEQRRPRGFLEKKLSLLRIASWFMDGVCPVYNGATQTMQERGIAREKIVPIINGTIESAATPEMIAEKRAELGAASTDFVLFTAASLIERKNIPMILRAFACALAKMPNLLLVVAGEGDQQQPLKELSCQLKVDKQIRWLGRRNDVAELCAAADLCLITSRAEALPFFCIETFAAGRTMIATPAGGVPEVVQDGANGVIVPFDDSEALAREILHLAQDSDLRRAYEIAAHETYLAHYSLDRMVESYISYYSRLLQDKKEPAASPL